MARKTQYEQLKEVAEKSGATITDGKALYPEEDFIRVFTFPNGESVSVPFDVETEKVSGISFLRLKGGGGSVWHDGFMKLKKAFTPKSEQKHYPAVELKDGDALEVGTGITYNMYSDSKAYTIVEVVNEKKVIARRCTVKLKNAEELKFHAGGFVAHCSNQSVQEYEYKDEEGNSLVTFTKRKDGRWYKEGESIRSARPASFGRRSEFYDYNF
jgi:hypothetical protein